MGPFQHLILAQRIHRNLSLDTQWADLPEDVFLAGSLAPDGGYYPGAETRISRRAHNEKPWDFCRTLFEQAQSAEDRAFALGWLSHALYDLRGHTELVNPASGMAYDVDPLPHKQVEWGLDAWALGQAEHQWLWGARLNPWAGLEHWALVWNRVYGEKTPRSSLLEAQQAQFKVMGLLPWAWWLGGRLTRPGWPLGNGLGLVLGATVRPVLAAYFSRSTGGIEQHAVLTPRRPPSDELATLQKIAGKVEYEFKSLIQNGAWPEGGLDAG